MANGAKGNRPRAKIRKRGWKTDNSRTWSGRQGGGRRFDDGFAIRNGGAGFAGVFADFSGNRHRIARWSVPPPARLGRGGGPGASVIGLRGLRFRNGRSVSSVGRSSRSAEGSRPPTVVRPSAATRRTPCRPLFYPLSSLQDPEDFQRPFIDDRPRGVVGFVDVSIRDFIGKRPGDHKRVFRFIQKHGGILRPFKKSKTIADDGDNGSYVVGIPQSGSSDRRKNRKDLSVYLTIDRLLVQSGFLGFAIGFVF